MLGFWDFSPLYFLLRFSSFCGVLREVRWILLVVDGRTEQILGNELPALAREVARVETVCAYAGENYPSICIFMQGFCALGSCLFVWNSISRN